MAMPAATTENHPEATVLVVDDETNIVELLSVSLKFQGFEVYTASNGSAALDKAREVKPDAVILDVMMPGMDGFGVLRRLRADGIDAPALFLTARDSLQDTIAGLTLGGDDYVTKPFSREEGVARLRVILRRSGRGAIEEAREVKPDAVILDVMMPGMDGFGVLRRLRADGIDAPALFLTARDSLQDTIAGLTLGGDDYVTKPFSREEGVARLRVILRRSGRGAIEESRSSRLTFADIELDEDTHEVWKAGEPVSLSPTEFTLLRYFIINAGTVLSKPKILDHVWRYDFGGDVNVVESYVSYLRRKIDTGDQRLLHTLRGVGYVLREPR